MQSEGASCILLRVLVITLHSELVGQLEEVLYCLVQLLAVLQAPGQLHVEVVPEFEPGQFPCVFIKFPTVRNLISFLLACKVRNFANNTFIARELREQTFQLVLRGNPSLVLVKFRAKELLDLILLPLIKDIFAVTTSELVLIFLLLSRHWNPCVLFLLVKVGSFLLFRLPFLLLQVSQLTDLSIEIFLALAE